MFLYILVSILQSTFLDNLPDLWFASPGCICNPPEEVACIERLGAL